jgi:hypothetical protein
VVQSRVPAKNLLIIQTNLQEPLAEVHKELKGQAMI